jgi:predicted RND superfamily exporter protein
VGIDNGVHVIHRVRFEGRHGMDVVLRHTGRAILISSFTTMIGFGSLSFASHRGLQSLGLLLLLGVGSCLVASIVVLPNLLVVLRIVPFQRSTDN